MIQTQIVILAAGQSKRMNSDQPKILHKIGGKEMIKYLLEAVKASGVCNRPVIVVGHQERLIKETLGDEYIYIEQKKQLGTGHAVAATKNYLEGKAGDILVLNGDHPLLQPETIKKLTKVHQKNNRVLTLGTSQLSDFEDWRRIFGDNFGRILRNKKGEIISIVEKKDATKKQEKILEVNPNYYCFRASWLWQNINRLENNNKQGEYYLTDLVKIAVGQGKKVASIQIEPKECLGVNNQEELALVRKFLSNY